MTPRFITSEPAFKPHVSQWQRDRATGEILPMQTPAHPMWRPEPLWKSALTVALLIVPFIVWSILA